ncbi:hypothetical protein TCON_2272 [Astathelohania contejeani]|uniref:Uncharacterized protein n=1 Tax=Astathelohania contejeani TaxID=164912 RepID=A0ABQ7HWL6_9MICR|nr:hypothetical protein TCON_2272 [Thelohania contejeani]
MDIDLEMYKLQSKDIDIEVNKFDCDRTMDIEEDMEEITVVKISENMGDDRTDNKLISICKNILAKINKKKLTNIMKIITIDHIILTCLILILSIFGIIILKKGYSWKEIGCKVYEYYKEN